MFLIALLAGCGAGSKEQASACPPPPSPQSPIAAIEGFETRNVHAKIVLEVEGAETFRIEDSTCLVVVEILGGETPSQTAFLSVATSAPLTVQETQVVASFTLSPGLYRGTGTYTLSEEGAVVLGGQQGLPSTAAVRVGRPAASVLLNFEKLVSPCRLEVNERGSSGDLSCPALDDESGKAIAFRWRWNRN